MKKIGLTLNRITIESYQEKRDSLDINWIHLFNQLNFFPILIPSNLLNPELFLKEINCDGFILTGGNDISASGKNDVPERENLEHIILTYAKVHYKKVLAVCRGMQSMNCFLGGKISSIENHVRTNHQLIVHDNLYPLNNSANSYHHFGIKASELASTLIPMATHQSDGSVEAFRDSSASKIGIMWHPERNQPFHSEDLNLIKNFFGE